MLKSSSHSHLIQGALFLILAEFSLVIMGSMIKLLGEELNHPMLVFCRNMAGLIFILPLLLKQKVSLKTKVFPLHLLRAVISLSAMYCYFVTLIHLPLSDAVLVKLTAPFFLPLIAALWLKESPSPLLLVVLPIGFAGVYCILDADGPTQAETLGYFAFGILGAFLAATAKTFIRKLSATEPTARIVFYFGLIATALSAIPLIWFWQPLNGDALLLLIVVGLCATCGQMAMTKAFSIAPAADIGPFTYSSVIFAAAIGAIFWQESLTLDDVYGSLLIIMGGLVMTQSHRLGSKPQSYKSSS